jgi:hypothetical protein
LLDEPPDADPHVRWCERGRLATALYSIPHLRREKWGVYSVKIVDPAETFDFAIALELRRVDLWRGTILV